MTEPTTAAGRACLEQWDDDPDMQALLLVHVLAIEAEARQQDGSALRHMEQLAEAMATDDGMNSWDWSDLSETGRNVWRKKAGRILAALPPSAPPALDVDVLRRAIDHCIWPVLEEHRIDQHKWAKAIAAEYARLQQDR